MDEDEQEEGREMSESITKELRSAAVTRGAIRIDAWDSIVVMSESKRDGVADRIDARFTHELQAKQDEIDGLKSDNAELQARLDASLPLPVDADGVPWTGEEARFFDVDGKEFAMSGILWDGESWSLCDETSGGQMYGFYACHHVAPKRELDGRGEQA